MARQEGLVLFTGRMANISFYKIDGVYYARKKSGVSAERIMTESAYARTRENIAEFGRATVAAKLIRRALAPLFQISRDSRVSSRLTGCLVKVIREDRKNNPGERNVMHGDLSLLEGFNFNRHGQLTSAFDAPFMPSIDAITERMTIDIPAFKNCDAMISAPPGATHYRFRAAAASIDFRGETYHTSTCESADLSLNEHEQGPLRLTLNVPPSAHPLLMGFGVEFLQMVNGELYAMDNKSNAMAIVKVDASPRNPKRDTDRRSLPGPVRRPRPRYTRSPLQLRSPVRKQEGKSKEVLSFDRRFDSG